MRSSSGDRGIEVRLNTRVNAITSERAILNTGDVIETNTVVTTVGNATNPVIKKLIDRYQLPNDKGRLITEPTMQVKGYKNLWSAGDCAAVPLKDGSVSPATAQFAMRQGTLLGKNIIAARNGQTVEPFRFKTLGEMASLGHRNAVGKVLGFKVSGFSRMADVASDLPLQIARAWSRSRRCFSNGVWSYCFPGILACSISK